MIELDYSASQKHIGYNYILFILQQIKQEKQVYQPVLQVPYYILGLHTFVNKSCKHIPVSVLYIPLPYFWSLTIFCNQPRQGIRILV